MGKHDMLLEPKEALGYDHAIDTFWLALIFLFPLLFLMLGIVVVSAFHSHLDELNIEAIKALEQ